jgi:hypothetical protein
MGAKVQDVTYNETGQTLVWDPPEGVPSSVTSVAVYALSTGDDGTAESATTGSASVDSVSTTLDATSGKGQSNERKLHLTATTNVAIGSDYIVTSAATAEWELVTVVAIASGDYVLVREPLQNAYASADTFKGTRLSISVDSTWVADSSNISDTVDPTPGYRVRWVYKTNSDADTHTHDSYFNLVRYPYNHSVTSADMLGFYPNWVNELPTYHREDRGQRLIEEAALEVRDDIFMAGHAAEMVRDQPRIDGLVKRKSNVFLFRSGRDVDMLAYYEGKYEAYMDQCIRIVTRVAEATGTDGGGADTTATGLWTK